VLRERNTGPYNSIETEHGNTTHNKGLFGARHSHGIRYEA